MHLSNFQWICTSRQNHEALKSKMRLNAEYAHYGLIFTDICIHYYFTGYLHQNTDALQKTAPLLGCWGKSTYNGCDATCNRVSTILEHQQAMAVESSPIWPIPNPTQIHLLQLPWWNLRHRVMDFKSSYWYTKFTQAGPIPQPWLTFHWIS